MTQSLSIKISGLYLNYNDYSEVPEGALSEATNIDILQNSVAQPRKGFALFGSLPTGARPNSFTEYKGTKYVTAENAGVNTIHYFNGTSFSDTTYSLGLSTIFKVHNTQANQALYYSAPNGITKVTSLGDIAPAGAPKALDMQASTDAGVSPKWLPTASQAAYRGLWVYKDTNGNLIRGTPSTRSILTNTTGATQGASITVSRPSWYTGIGGGSWIFQLYRSATVATGIEPSDEMGLVSETVATLSTTKGTFTVNDGLEDSLRGATLYTSQSQEGLAYQNERLPIAKDIANWRDSVFFGNIASTQRYFFSMKSASTMTIGDSITITTPIGTNTYVAAAIENYATHEFQLWTTGTTDVINTKRTADSLVRVINRASGSYVDAFEISSPDEAPGKLLFEGILSVTGAFSVTSNKSTIWVPSLPSSGTSQSSTKDEYVNGLAWSKPGEAESVPLVNFATVGSKNYPITRIIPLEQALYIFKQNEGLYKLSGYYPNFQIDLVDSSVRLIAPETAQVLGNRIYCLTDQGVCAVDDSTSILSRPIEYELLNICTQEAENVDLHAFALANETERSYSLYIPELGGSTPTFSYVYNSFTNSWVRHTVPAVCGSVANDKSVYLGSATSAKVLKRRNAGTNEDYVDYVDYSDLYAPATKIAQINTNEILLDPIAVAVYADVKVGDVIYQSPSVHATVVAVKDTYTIVLDTNPGFTTVADTTILKAIPTRMTWCAVAFGNASIQHQYHTATLIFREGFLGTGTMEFATDTSQITEVLDLLTHYGNNWGMFGWGMSPWGSPTHADSVRQWVPRAKQRSISIIPTFTNRCAYSGWQLVGMSIFGVEGSEGIGRNNV